MIVSIGKDGVGLEMRRVIALLEDLGSLLVGSGENVLRLRAGRMQRFLALGRSVLQRACDLVGGRESVCDARLAFVHGLENRRPDELPGERNEDQERDALKDQSSVKVHSSSPLRRTGSGAGDGNSQAALEDRKRDMWGKD